MRWSKTLIPTLKEVPSDAECVSHRLMLRAGLIRKLSAGTYSYLPLGLRILKKVEAIVRQEMDSAGALEVFLPAIQPAEIWRESGRYMELGDDMLKLKDRHGREMVLGPTHEEVITRLVKGEIKSYRQLPLTLYQIQTKFRDEMRPRFGVLRSSEFIMKDAYSFDVDRKGLNLSYQKMYEAYCRILQRCGIPYTVVEADPGVMGGETSAEFMVLSGTGEDLIVHCKSCGYATGFSVASCPKATSRARMTKSRKDFKPLKEVPTPGVTTIEKVGALLKVEARNMVKTLIYEADEEPVAALVRGGHDLNEAKLKKLLGASQLKMADLEFIQKVTGAPLGFSGPVGLRGIKIIADHSISELTNFVTGANKKDLHLINVNLGRDFKPDQFKDIRYITPEDRCPKCGKTIKIERGIEIGHVFRLGTRYSEALGAKYVDKNGSQKTMIMGCYGIGINRMVAAAIEMNHDKDGIIWPISLSPYEVLILLLNPAHKPSKDAAEAIYRDMEKEGIEVLLDDRNERAGVKFKDADLIGIPIRVIVGERALNKGDVEIKLRKGARLIPAKVGEALEAAKKNLDRLRKAL